MARNVFDSRPSNIERIFKNSLLLEEIPAIRELRNSATSTKEKRCCGGRVKKVSSIDYAAVRRGLAQLSEEDKLRLKQLLSIDQVQIDYTSGSGKRIRMTF